MAELAVTPEALLAVKEALAAFDLDVVEAPSEQAAEQVQSVTVSPPERLAVLSDTRDFIRKYVVLPDDELVTLTLWVAHTHAISASNCTPYMAVQSKTKRCGKTRLLETVELLVANPERTSDTSESALFRMLREGTKTILLDEYDTVFQGGKKSEGLRSLLNAGYRRGSPVRRTQGRKVEAFDVYGPKIIAGIGQLPDTVADRSVPIVMIRRDDEEVARFRYQRAKEEGGEIQRRLQDAFGRDMDWLELLTAHKPELPEVNDRAQDSWEPLLAIAEVVGGSWAEDAMKAAHELSS